jgi:septal ring factor EnvC (AmiA/AmiB activator)
VASPVSGLVEYAGPLNGWGQVLILRGPGGYHMVLAGLSRLAVLQGQSVAAGQAVGRVAEGANPAPRLYMEVRRNDVPVNPAPLLPQIGR